mgnify:CR=1 FL=1
MHFTIGKKLFLRGLSRCHGVADRKASMPILSNLLLQSEGKARLGVRATDLYLGVHASVEADIEEEGAIAVNARTLFDIVKNLPEGDVRCALLPAQGLEIRAGKVRYRIGGMPATEFPSLPSAGEGHFYTLDGDLLLTLIGRTHYAMSSDDSRPHLAGALFQVDAQALRMVTTDGHRLSKAEVEQEGGEGSDFSMLIPARGIQELKRLIEDLKAARGKGEEGPLSVELAKVGNHAFFRAPGLELSVKLTDENFPPYEKVIPQQQSRRVVASRASLMEALRRMTLVTSNRGSGIRMQLDPGILRVASESHEVGEGSEEVDVDYAGEPLTIGFNARYLLDALTALEDDDIALELSGELDPGVVRPATQERRDFVGVVMPMRI